MSARHPSREDRALWRRSMRGVTPLAPARAARATEETEPEIERAPAPRPRPMTTPVKRAQSLPPLAPGDSPGVDRRTAEKFRRGQLAVDARLDLHGMTQAEAHPALASFIQRAHASGLRTVLVITGKGGFGDARGVLREAVPRWLNEGDLRPRVLSCAWAQPKHGGAGALYVLLRRQR
ncbi:MAG TPA: Smr/MutS family protein [Stellaceae bacterium]|nr:Smr/MutS family protein [Stellaceae bacterium]